MAGVHVTVDTSSLTAPGGMIDRDIERRATNVESGARVRAPVKNTGLRDSINKERGPRRLAWYVKASVAYAMWIHEGKRNDPRTGKTIFVRVGARPFLVDALQEALL